MTALDLSESLTGQILPRRQIPALRSLAATVKPEVGLQNVELMGRGCERQLMKSQETVTLSVNVQRGEVVIIHPKHAPPTPARSVLQDFTT